MKHLKKFNESTLDKEEIQDFCETHLAYLIDEGLEVECYQFNESNKEVAYITLGYKLEYKLEDDSHNLRVLYLHSQSSTNSTYEYNFPSWNEIKDNIIPFFTHLSNKYDLLKKGGKEVWISYVTTTDNTQVPQRVYYTQDHFKFSLKDIINDNEVLGKLNGRYRILNIRCNVMEKNLVNNETFKKVYNRIK